MTPEQPENTTPTPAGTGSTTDAAKTFTQEELEAIISRRLAEERDRNQRRIAEKYGDLDALKKAQERLGELEAAQMTELEKKQRQIEQLETQMKQREQEAQEATLKALRLRVGQEMGLPVALSERLVGSTEDEVKADAQRVLAQMQQWGKPAPPNLDATAGGASLMSHTKLTPEQEDIIAKTPGMTREKYIERQNRLSGG